MNVFIFLLALIPILFIGVLLIEMLLTSAPRRGKWSFAPIRKRLRTARAAAQSRLPVTASQATSATPPARTAGAGGGAHGAAKVVRRIKILTPGGYLLEGTAEHLVLRLSRMGDAERNLLRRDEQWLSDPEGFLRRLDADGLLLVQAED